MFITRLSAQHLEGARKLTFEIEQGSAENAKE